MQLTKLKEIISQATPPTSLLSSLLSVEESDGVMQEVAIFYRGTLPTEGVDNFVAEINALTGMYNVSTDIIQKKQLLRGMQVRIKQIESEYPQHWYATAGDYRKAMRALFVSIQDQSRSLGLPSVADLSMQSPTWLVEMLATMSPDKVDKLLRLLLPGSKADLATLHTLYPGSDQREEAVRFAKFLSDYSLSYLGGANSKNFLIKHLHDGSEFVLKVENRLEHSKKAETYLRDKLPQTISPIYLERQAFCLDDAGDPVCRNVSIIPYYHQGSFHEKQPTVTDMGEFSRDNCILFEQMARIMLDIQEKGCVFTDSKISNWLLDEHNNLQVADTKSFLFIDEQGHYHSRIVKRNKNDQRIVITSTYRPPEISDEAAVADSVHAYILGKNLFYYFTRIEDKMFDIPGSYFYDPIWNNSVGQEIKALILSLVNSKVEARISLKEAINELFMITYPGFRDVFTELVRLKTGTQNKEIDEYIAQMQQDIKNAKNDSARVSLYQRLEISVADLKKIPVLFKQLAALNEGVEDRAMDAFIQESQTRILATPVGDRGPMLEELQQLITQLQGSRKTFDRLVLALNLLKFGNDAEMDVFIERKKTEFNTLSPPERIAFLQTLESNIVELTSNPSQLKVREIVAYYRATAGLFTLGMYAKADKIETEMSLIPVVERLTFYTPAGHSKLLEALDEPRAKILKDPKLLKEYKLFAYDMDNEYFESTNAGVGGPKK